MELIIYSQRHKIKQRNAVFNWFFIFCRAIIAGRPLIRRLINATCGMSKSYHEIRV